MKSIAPCVIYPYILIYIVYIFWHFIDIHTHATLTKSCEEVASCLRISLFVVCVFAQYLRSEEVETLSIALEQALLDLRDAITLNCPSLLPLVHSLSNELRKERALAHEQKVRTGLHYTSFVSCGFDM